jgi:L-fuculose-phosphate aldolase
MPKIILTDQDIEEKAREGITTLQIGEDILLTDLAFEKAKKLGISIIQRGGELPPAAPVRPYVLKSTGPSSMGEQIPVIKNVAMQIETPASQLRNVLRFRPDSSESELRAAIVEAGRIAYQSGLMVSNDGNISARTADGNVLITPSGVCKGRIKPEDLLVVDLNGKLVKAAADPTLKPTSEQPMHLEVYNQRSDVRAVIHTHLIFANALAISQGKIRMDVIPEAAIAFGNIPITDFSLPSSTQNADAVRDLIKNHDVLLIRNHGSLTVGKNLDEALIHTERLEHVSKTLTFAELLGDVNTLPPDMMAAINQIVEKSRSDNRGK